MHDTRAHASPLAGPHPLSPSPPCGPHPFDPLSLRERGNAVRPSFPLIVLTPCPPLRMAERGNERGVRRLEGMAVRRHRFGAARNPLPMQGAERRLIWAPLTGELLECD